MLLVKRNGSLSTHRKPLFENLFDSDLFNTGDTTSKSIMPAVNIKETEDNFTLELAAPGMDKKDFKIEMDGETLIISAEKESGTEEKQEIYTRKEFNYSAFKRSFHLAKNVVDADKIIARYENGILHLDIAKREEIKQKLARSIEIS